MYKLKKLFSNLDDMHKEELFCDAISMLDDQEMSFIKIKMSKIVNDGHLSEEEASEWVASMQPHNTHWSKIETSALIPQGINENDWFAIMNMFYSDYSDVLGEDASIYVKMAKKWFDDIDVKCKTFNYYHHVVKEI